ncbi:hypothetical protein V6N13_051575 [Hibiscus sabdariffa]|uniref:Uncharacterized protein n=1 Tax=Hibiscus sabdariffa TaxID=183260 RepID=A0ABR2T3S1_9ROSI
MGRKPCCPKEGMNKGSWSANEDQILTNYIQTHGEGKWRDLPQRAGLKRCGKSCRLRWKNYLRPTIKRGNISVDEEELIIRLHKLLDNERLIFDAFKWSLIAGRLPGRTDNEIKNYWNTNLSKRLNGQKDNISPNTTTQAFDHKVIHTKAVKCTKAVNITLDPKLEIIGSTETTSSSTINEDNNSLDFFMDFDIDELFVPECDPISDMGYDDGFNLVVDEGLSTLDLVSTCDSLADNLYCYHSENFSPARAKGFLIASIAVFAGVEDIAAAEGNEEYVNLQKQKVRDHLDGVIVVDYVMLRSPSNL